VPSNVSWYLLGGVATPWDLIDLFTQSTAVLHKHLTDKRKYLVCYNFSTDVAQNSLMIPQVFPCSEKSPSIPGLWPPCVIMASTDAPIGRSSAVLPIIGIGRLLCWYRPIVIYYVLWWHWILKLYFLISKDDTNSRFIVIYANSANMLVALCSYALVCYIIQ